MSAEPTVAVVAVGSRWTLRSPGNEGTLAIVDDYDSTRQIIRLRRFNPARPKKKHHSSWISLKSFQGYDPVLLKEPTAPQINPQAEEEFRLVSGLLREIQDALVPVLSGRHGRHIIVAALGALIGQIALANDDPSDPGKKEAAQ